MTRDAFKPRKLPEDIDYVVVGSGVGGLYTAALLARTGRKVVVLEQHYIAGGCMHTFHDKGFEFDTGIHYIGRVEKYGELMNLCSLKGSEVKWQRLGTEEDGYAYDIILPGKYKPHAYRRGKERFKADLLERFPDEEEAIDRYIYHCNKTNKAADVWFFAKLFPVWLQKLMLRFGAKYHLKWAGSTVEHVLRNECGVKSDELYAILCGQAGDYGMFPSEASFFIHAGIVSHYMDGAYYPIGGPEKLTEALIETIEHTGGRVLVKAPVSDVIIENGHAVGVKVKGTEVRVRSGGGVICAGGAHATLKILESTGLEAAGKLPWAAEMRELVSEGLGHMSAFLGLDVSQEELKAPAANQWVLPYLSEGDYETACQHYYKHGIDNTDNIMMFMGFPSAKDPTYGARCPGKSACVVVCEAKQEWFAQWQGGKSGKRKKPDYDEFKNKWMDKILTCLYKLFPETKGKVVYKSIGSPLTNQYYLYRSGSYGLEPSPDRFTCDAMAALRPQVSGVPGLFITGQDLTTAGWAGALSAGMVTAMAILGYNFLDLVVLKRNLIEDLMTLPRLAPLADSASADHAKTD